MPSTLHAQLLDRIPELLTEWHAFATEEPWVELPEEHGIDNLVNVLHAMVDVSADPTREALRRLIDEAVTHGTHRRAEGLDADVLMHEYTVLRVCVGRVVRRLDATEDQRTAALLLLDAETTTATRGSLLGWSREKLERTRRWEESLARLLDDSEATYRSAPVRTLATSVRSIVGVADAEVAIPGR